LTLLITYLILAYVIIIWRALEVLDYIMAMSPMEQAWIVGEVILAPIVLPFIGIKLAYSCAVGLIQK
jgi:hypothetical protein